MEALHDLGTGLLFRKDLQGALEKVLESSIELLDAESGRIELLAPDLDRLCVVAQYGSPDGLPMSRQQLKDAFAPGPAPAGNAALPASTMHAVPLRSRRDELLGAITTCFARPRQLSRHEVRMLDLYAQQASAYIEHMRMQQALRDSEAYLSTLFTNAPVGLSEISLEGRFRKVNRALCQMLCRSEEEMLRASVMDVTAPDDLPASLDAMKRVLDTGEVASIDKEYLRPDGSKVPANSIFNRLLDQWGQPRAILAVTVDMSGRKLAEAALRKSEERYRTLFETIDEGFGLFDPMPGETGAPVDFRIVEVNPAFERETGMSNVTGKTIREVAAGNEQFWLDYFGRVFRTGGSERALFFSRILQRWLSVNAFAIGRTDRRRIAVLLSNITEQKRVQDELAISNERLHLAVEGAGDGVWDWNIEDDTVALTGRWIGILGYQPADQGTPVGEWRERIHPDDVARVAAEVQACLDASVATFVSEFRMRCKDGSYKWVLARGIVVKRDADGRPLRMTGMMSDISERKQSEELIWRHANFDALTGLPNRRLFRDRLEQEVRKAQGAHSQLALLFIDLDRFKQVNDLLGHDAGDHLLLQAAQRLRSCVRDADTVARLGGDEFTVILSQLNGSGQVEQAAQKLLDTLAKPFSIGSEVSYLSGSIGITLYPADATTTEELIRKADQAMYAAKSGGKNRFSYFTQAMDQRAHMRLTLSNELRNALGQHELEVYYQPVVDLSAGNIVKAEALLRWHHPRLGMVQPSEFIPVAEESGTINAIGDWVFRQAAQCSQRWGRRTGRPFQIGVNRSPAQFLSRGGEDPIDYLRQLGLAGNSMSVEITEGLLLNASESVSDRLLEFREAGVQVAIDDFGTGYSSMAYLRRFNIDYLKIDQSFVHDMEIDDGNRAIAESIIVMAHRLGLKVIAEGIETAGQRDLLRAAGCDFGQGFFFSEAVPPAAFEQLLERELH